MATSPKQNRSVSPSISIMIYHSYNFFSKALCRKLLLLPILLLIIATQALAQLPADMSGIRASQITDEQLQQFVRQAESSGMSEAQLMQEFQRRGLPASEMQALAARVRGLSGAAPSPAGNAETGAGAKRTYKDETATVLQEATKSRVFGAELFSSANPLFVPNLKVPTPMNYVIGPEDELQLDIYGNNISAQKLNVTPEGKVNVKYAGLVTVSGLTIEQATAAIRTRLLQYYPGLSSGGTKIALTLASVRSIQVMVVGAVKKPGTITVPSVATLFNALYASGGPLDNGSFRNIQLVRNNQVVAEADLYSFILKGDQKSNVALRDNDVILVPYAERQIILSGALNREGVFEIKENETLANALQYAGGFQSNAFRGNISGTRIAQMEKKIIDVSAPSFNAFALEHGDSLFVSKVIDRFENRVSISGAVFKPGSYALEQGMDIRALVDKAQGLKEDAFKGRVNMVRMNEDRSKQYLSVSLSEVLNGKNSIFLKKEDSLHVTSVLQLRDSTTVSIYGSVRNPGNFRFEDSLSLEALILQAGGFAEDALPDRIEIGRRNLSANPMQVGSATSEIIEIKLDKNLRSTGGDIALRPYDVVSVKSDPARVKQIRVAISGEVLYAGSYTLSNPEERLSSVLNRAGGLLPYADLDGARLIRRRLQVDTSEAKRLLQQFKNKSATDTLSESDIKPLEENNTDIALDLRKALSNPGGARDLVLEDGDEIVVPRKSNTVGVQGNVLNPINVQYSGSRLGRYIAAAGGYGPKASKKKVFVIYPNGSAAKTRSFLGVRDYPSVLPGSSVFVPSRPPSKGFDAAKAGVIVSTLTTLLTTVILLTR